MKGSIYIKALIVFSVMFFVGCAAPQFKPTPFTPQRIDMEQYVPKVDNFLILFDASSSMTDEIYNGKAKINIAKDVVYHMNQALPNLNIKAGMLAFGQNPSVGPGDTALVYGMSDYTKGGLNGGIDAVQKEGLTTPIEAALRVAGSDLKNAQGPIAVILVSDGQNPAIPNLAALDAATSDLKKEYGDRLCIYTIGIGDDRAGLNRLKKIAEIGVCGFYTNANDLNSSEAMANFVEKVFLAKRPPKPAPAPAPMPAAPKPAAKKCPEPLKGATLDSDGCWEIPMIHFDFDKSNIKPEYDPVLNEIADVMKQNPTLTMTIEGNTDNIGTEAYNQGLSERRAQSAKQYLIDKGIDADRLTTIGNGFLKPIVSNDTEAGRAENRRDEFTPSRR